MTQDKRAIIIGAGIGGLTTAINLSQKGYRVTVFEKNLHPGGRCGNIVKNGHRFDTGATFLMMPEIYEDTYSRFGRYMDEELELHRLDPVYKLHFKDGRVITFTPDLQDLRRQMEAIEPGSFNKFLKLLPEGHRAYKQAIKHVVDHNYTSLLDIALVKQLYILLRFKAFTNHYSFIKRHFKSEVLRNLFTFQNLYLGQNPLKSSGIYFFMPFMELTSGVLYPKGGMHQIIKNLVSIAEGAGVVLNLNASVTGVKVNGSLARGIELKDGSYHEADIIIANADLPYVYNNLLPPSRMARRISNKKYTCSAVAFHWGIDTVFPGLEQHNVFVSDSHKENFDAIFKHKSVPEEPTIYVHSPVRCDPSAAPAGEDSLTAIVHAGHLNGEEQDWQEMKARAREAIIRRLENEGMKDFEKHIKFEICHTPKTYQSHFNLTRGAVFGSLAHNILQMGYFRPKNRHKVYKNLYFVGGSTQPGSGMPLSLLSAKLVTERIINSN